MVCSESLGRAWNKTTQFLACYFPTSPTFHQLSPLQNLRGEWPWGSLRLPSQSSFWDGRRGLGDHSELTSYLQLCSAHAGDGSWPGGETADSLRKFQKQNIDDILAETRWKATAFSKLACKTGREVWEGRDPKYPSNLTAVTTLLLLFLRMSKAQTWPQALACDRVTKCLVLNWLAWCLSSVPKLGVGGDSEYMKICFFPNKGFYINVYACNMHVTLDCGLKSEKQYI